MVKHFIASVLLATVGTAQVPSLLNAKVTAEWYTSNKCSFYQNEQDTLFVCNKNEVYLLPRDLPYYDSTSSPLTINLYNAAFFGLDGNIRSVFPMAGDASKMYFIDTKTAGGVVSFVALELAASRDALNRVSTIRPVFSLSSALEPEWLAFSQDDSWFVTFRKNDHFQTMMEVDLFASSYTRAVGSDFTNSGYRRTLAKDFDAAQNTLSYIDPTRRFIQTSIQDSHDHGSGLISQYISVSASLKQALDMSSNSEIRFQSFARAGKFWVFGNDFSSVAPQVLIYLPNQKVLTIEPSVAIAGPNEKFAEHVWITENGGDGGAIIGLTIQKSSTREIQFYKVFPAEDNSNGYASYKVPNTIQVNNVAEFGSGVLVNSRFTYQPSASSAGSAPLSLLFCEPSQFFNSETKLCQACPEANQGSTDSSPDKCQSCGQIWATASARGDQQSLRELATAKRICSNPESVYICETIDSSQCPLSGWWDRFYQRFKRTGWMLGIATLILLLTILAGICVCIDKRAKQAQDEREAERKEEIDLLFDSNIQLQKLKEYHTVRAADESLNASPVQGDSTAFQNPHNSHSGDISSASISVRMDARVQLNSNKNQNSTPATEDFNHQAFPPGPKVNAGINEDDLAYATKIDLNNSLISAGIDKTMLQHSMIVSAPGTQLGNGRIFDDEDQNRA